MPPKRKRRGSFHAYRPNVEREAMRRDNVRATDEIVAALNERRIFLAYETVAAAADRKAGVLRVPDAHPARRRQSDRGAARSFRSRSGSAWCGCSTHRVLELVVDEMIANAGLAGEPQRFAGFDHRSRLVGGLGLAACARIPASPSG